MNFKFYFSFINDDCTKINKITIGMHSYFANYKLSDGSYVEAKIIDTGGIEKFKSINNSYYQIADCFLLVYDITDRQSFNDCRSFFCSKIEENCKKKYNILLLGNKIDLKDKRVIPYEKGSTLAFNYNYSFMESSCVTNENVFNAFQTLLEIANMRQMKVKEKENKEIKEEKKIRDDDKFEEKIEIFPKIMEFLNY